jgi:ribosomal protein L24
MRGRHAGTSGDVISVDRRRFVITVEGVTVKKSDGKEKPKPIHPSDVVLTKLDLTDKLRRGKLGATEADVEAKPKKEKAAKAGKAEPSQPTPAERAAAKRAAKAEEPEDEDEEEAS